MARAIQSPHETLVKLILHSPAQSKCVFSVPEMGLAWPRSSTRRFRGSPKAISREPARTREALTKLKSHSTAPALSKCTFFLFSGIWCRRGYKSSTSGDVLGGGGRARPTPPRQLMNFYFSVFFLIFPIYGTPLTPYPQK